MTHHTPIRTPAAKATTHGTHTTRRREIQVDDLTQLSEDLAQGEYIRGFFEGRRVERQYKRFIEIRGYALTFAFGAFAGFVLAIASL